MTLLKFLINAAFLYNNQLKVKTFYRRIYRGAARKGLVRCRNSMLVSKLLDGGPPPLLYDYNKIFTETSKGLSAHSTNKTYNL